MMSGIRANTDSGMLGCGFGHGHLQYWVYAEERERVLRNIEGAWDRAADGCAAQQYVTAGGFREAGGSGLLPQGDLRGGVRARASARAVGGVVHRLSQGEGLVGGACQGVSEAYQGAEGRKRFGQGKLQEEDRAFVQ